MSTKFWPILPAAGVGSRMQAARPKQYLSLAGQFLMDHTLTTLLSYPAFEQLVLVLSEQDSYWPQSQFFNDKRIIRAAGGSERCYSVLNGLKAIKDLAQADDWVLVHDIARPCLDHSDLDKLLKSLKEEAGSSGALLATPVRDSMKRGKILDNRVANQQSIAVIDHSVERNQLWHALTPQVFRYQALYSALERCLADNKEVTDEASAMEYCGYQPLLVEGRGDNIKVTRPEDLALAEFFLTKKTT